MAGETKSLITVYRQQGDQEILIAEYPINFLSGIYYMETVALRATERRIGEVHDGDVILRLEFFGTPKFHRSAINSQVAVLPPRAAAHILAILLVGLACNEDRTLIDERADAIADLYLLVEAQLTESDHAHG